MVHSAATEQPIAALSALQEAEQTVIGVLAEKDLTFCEDQVKDYVKSAAGEFSLAATAISAHTQQWIHALRHCHATAPAVTRPGAESPTLTACFNEMEKIDWQALLIIESFYPGLPVVKFHAEYCAGLQKDREEIALYRAGVQSTFDAVKSAIRTITLSAALDEITCEVAEAQLITVLDEGLAAIRRHF